MERLPRVLPFWMMLLGIVGFFILGVLYFDVRGWESRQPESPATVRVENFQPQPQPPPEPSEATSTPTAVKEEPVPLALPPETPASDIPAVAVFDCWRFETRDDRVIVDRAYRNFGNDSVPLVGTNTLHLSCQGQDWVARSEDGTRTVFVQEYGETTQDVRFLGEPGSIHVVDPYTGQTQKIAAVSPLSAMAQYAVISVTLDPTNTYADLVYQTKNERVLVRVSLPGGVTTIIPSKNVTNSVSINPAHTTAIGIEWSCASPDRLCAQFPVFIHRLNLKTGKNIRVGEISDIAYGVDPIFVDDEHVIIAGEATPAYIMNIFTRATAPIKQITSPLDRLAITTDGQNIVATGPNQPFTVIPVSELPKP